MSVRVTIETASKAEAELIAALLEPVARAESWRGFGVIRLRLLRESETADVLERVAAGVAQHSLPWARVRYDDEEQVFRAKRNGAHRIDRSETSPPKVAPEVAVRPSLVEMVAERTLERSSTRPVERLSEET